MRETLKTLSLTSMTSKLTTEQKIKQYLRTGILEKKPRLTTKEVVAYANTQGADWTVEEYEERKERNLSNGIAWTRGYYKGYQVYALSKKTGRRFCIFSSAETYRTIGDLLRDLPNFNTLRGW